MENHSPGSAPAAAARERLRAARQAHDASARRAMVPAGLILALSVFCGAVSVAPAHPGPRHVVTIVALAWSVAELLRVAARHQWRPLIVAACLLGAQASYRRRGSRAWPR